MTTLTDHPFGAAFGRPARLFTLDNGLISASFTDLGAALAGLYVFDARGVKRNLVLSYDSAEGYAAGSRFIGATVGRCAGRISGASFTLGGERFLLPANDGKNHLHGCFSKRFFSASAADGALVLSLVSPDGEEGFPGELALRVTARLDGPALVISYEAEADRDTVVNLTNHAYFNLDGGGTVGEHLLRVNAEEYAEVAEGLIPTGRLLPVSGTALDFTHARPLREALDAPELAATRGLDHSFILDGAGMKKAAELCSPVSGIRLECFTTQPTVHVYTAGFLDTDSAPSLRGGLPALRHGGVCLETQHLPDSPNRPEFPSTLLSKGGVLSEETRFAFSLV